jgi:predicted CXXCH cytochrome family protein
VRVRTLALCSTVLLAGATLFAQVSGDVIGVHNLGHGSKSPVTGARPDFCNYCHAPHGGLNRGLWNQKLSTESYTLYRSDTEKNRSTQPVLGDDSSHCLSCHDGTVAVGTTVVSGKVSTQGAMTQVDVFGSNLQTSHPFSLALPMQDNVDLVASLAAKGGTADPTGAVKLINGNIECTTCHDPHVQAKDQVSQNFLVRDSSKGEMCLACHDPERQMSGKVNPLTGWTTGAHALSTARISPQAGVGHYHTMAESACISCHTPHNASGPARLLRGQNEQDCIACHSGGSNLSPAAPDIFAEYAAPKVGHPFPTSTRPHDPAESTLLNNNRHATCVDCHNGHSSERVGVFSPPPLIRASQNGVAGISATDGTRVVDPAVNQFETCLRCHGSSAGKQVKPVYGYLPARLVSAGDPQNLVPQFAVTSASSHPVTHDRGSPLPQPSLLSNMLNLDGMTRGRAMGVRIFCTDCHNSDDNREFGGTGPNGPHGSKWMHILERRYELSEATAPGQLITNLFPNPDLSVNGPYAMCGKCHDLANQIVRNTSWSQHGLHINAGLSCSTCHTPHGTGGGSPSVSGQRLVNFDVNVVAPNGGLPISYNRAANTCVLACHQTAHNANGTVSGKTTHPSAGRPGKK